MKNRLITRCVMTSIVTVVAVAPRCMAASTPRLTVVIYDYAHVGPETLAATEIRSQRSSLTRMFS
jgi:hypothetical protein